MKSKFISLSDIRKLEILVPPLELQNEFVAFVEQLDKSKFLCKLLVQHRFK